MNKMYKRIKSFSDKVKGIDKKAVSVSLIVAFIFVLIWVIFGLHINDFGTIYKKAMNDIIMSQTENESENISTAISGRVNSVRYMKNSLTSVDEENLNKVIYSALNHINSSGEFTDVIYVDRNDIVYYSNGVKEVMPEIRSITDLVGPTDQYKVFMNMDHLITGEDGFGIVAPIIRNSSLAGYVVAFCPFDELVDTAYIRRELIHEEIIVDKTGHILAQINEDSTVKIAENHIDFFEKLESVTTAEAYSYFMTEYSECVGSMTAGKTMLLTNGEDILYIYYPIECTDGWTVINCYPDSLIASRMKTVWIKSVLIFAFIVLLMVTAAVILFKYLGGERKRISALEYLDGLTGVFNRSAFIAQAEEVLKENKTYPYNIVCFDVVNFRIINETYGHERSDEIIKAMAEACKEAFGHNEAYGRLTADVFVALVIDDGEESERISLIEKKVKKVAEKFYINHPIKIKLGRCSVDNTLDTVNRMIDKANIARKYVNVNGANLTCQYSEELMIEARKAEEIESKMEDALMSGEFKPFLQAKYNMVENHVCGAEALVRWIKPNGTIVPPGDFIPIFEKNGFVEKLDFYMLEEICKYVRKMLDENREVYPISVNQSRYLMNDPEYVNKVKKILLKYQIPVGLVELELTETVFFHEKDRMINVMNNLKKMNVDLSIDDFGSGYSSFNILKDVPFDVLKIDREFLTDSVHTDKGRWILQEIVEMAHGLGMSVICEGVETREHVELLVSINCHKAQGFYYARPIPIEEFIDKFNLKKAQ